MRVGWALGLCVVAGFVNAGCSMIGSRSDAGISAAVPPAPPPVAYGAFLEGPIGQKITPADRDKALAAEQDALATGQRKTWKGDHGTFGYVEPAAAATPAPVADAAEGDAPPPAGGGGCRAFTSTIFIAGRPQVGHGTGCQNPDGTYRIAS